MSACLSRGRNEVILQTFRFDDHHQHKAKLKGQPSTIDEVLSKPAHDQLARNVETKDEEEKAHVFPLELFQGPRVHKLIKREHETQSRVLQKKPADTLNKMTV